MIKIQKINFPTLKKIVPIRVKRRFYRRTEFNKTSRF